MINFAQAFFFQKIISGIPSEFHQIGNMNMLDPGQARYIIDTLMYCKGGGGGVVIYNIYIKQKKETSHVYLILIFSRHL